MFRVKHKKVALISLLGLSMLGSSFYSVSAYSPVPGSTNYVAISVDDVKAEARRDLNNARLAGRLSKEEADKLSSDLESAYSLSGVEEVWADLLAKAQEARAKHPSIDHLVSVWTSKLDQLVRNKTIQATATTPYKERLKAIERLKKQFYNDDHFYDFWEYTVLAIDLSSLNDKLERALVQNKITVEKLNDLILRSDNYIARNQVCSRGLTTFKSFEIEPDHLQQVRQELYTVLKDKANSKLSTPQVKEQLFKRLLATHYEACSSLPSENDLNKAIQEVERLLDSGARNGNLSARDAVRLLHELQLVKELKKAYPGPTPGVDLVERELRKEEVRFMAIDLRMMQDWLGRVLRKDGEVQEGREQVLRLVRRIDLAIFSHRITDQDANNLLSGLDEAIKKSNNDSELASNVRNLQEQLDMMVADFSLQPAETKARVSDISSLVAQLKMDQSSASADKDRIQRIISQMDSQDSAAKKYGMSVVAASELEMLRNKVFPMIKAQRVIDSQK